MVQHVECSAVKIAAAYFFARKVLGVDEQRAKSRSSKLASSHGASRAGADDDDVPCGKRHIARGGCGLGGDVHGFFHVIR